jgi:bisphosphoglycerate-independent phosphoglycerate mutase (AlkP superfamily)
VEYYTARKKKEMMVFAGKWVEQETIVSSKISQTQKYKHV